MTRRAADDNPAAIYRDSLSRGAADGEGRALDGVPVRVVRRRAAPDEGLLRRAAEDLIVGRDERDLAARVDPQLNAG